MSLSPKAQDRLNAILIGIGASVLGVLLIFSGVSFGNTSNAGVMVLGCFILTFGLFYRLPTWWFSVTCIIGGGAGLAYFITQYVFI